MAKTTFKKLLINLLLALIEGLRKLGHYIKVLLITVTKPVAFLWKKLFRPLVIKVYKFYLFVTNKIKRALGINKRLNFLFSNRYVVHVSIVIMALVVASTNIVQASEIRPEDFQTKTILHDIVQPEIGDDEDIVETSESIKKSDKQYVDTSTSLVSNIPVIEEDDSVQGNLLISEGGGALVKSNILDTKLGYTTDIREHEVKEGETASMIAEDYGISLATLQWANGLGSSTVIKPGEKLKIPPVDGVIYTIESGDTLLDVVSKRKGDIDKVRELNEIGDDDLIAVGTTIIIPDGQPYTPPPPPTTSSSGSTSGSSGTTGGWTSVFNPSNQPSAPAASGQFGWPSASHDISQYSRWGHIAIDIRGPMGTAIYASAGGVATLHSGGGYGNYIIVDHQNGWSTLYAHLSSYGVSNGQYVSQGQYIGGEGSTGWSTGPHLHFEIRQGGTKYNPLDLL